MEHKGGHHSYYSQKAHLFSNFIASYELLDIGYIGSDFTWCNNQIDLARQWARLDMCLVNLVCTCKFDSYSLKHLPRIFSDHAPLFLFVSLRHFHKNKILCFYNF